MERVCKRLGCALAALTLLVCAGCASVPGAERTDAPADAARSAETPEALYERALQEDVLIVYTVSTRVTAVKEAFEAAYPGLCVEVRDLRSPDLVDAVEKNHREGLSACDVVLCNDNSGDFKARLVDTGVVVPYLPDDIAPHMKEPLSGGVLPFVYEAELLFYDGTRFDACPIGNLWALTEERWRGRIYMPNPLRSFSTYAFCGASFERSDELAKAYRDYAGEELPVPEGSNAAEEFWRRAAKNIVFTNSSDEVAEALGNGEADFGVMVSSKLRLRGVGYGLAPVWRLEPFSGCRTSCAAMLAADAKNVNCAKLFLRFLMGEADGKGAGCEPFRTPGTWSARDDVADGTDVPLSEVDLIVPNQERLIAQRAELERFWAEILKENTADEP
ncbi:MAG: substrate-binding domain-containing protein [Oscillospiraceae bacterium]|nr:substrate-binding domain-containing protein [Oscillospiraceae bacterium]